MNIFKIISFEDNYTLIELEKEPTNDELPLLHDFIYRKKGIKFDSSNKSFTIYRKTNENDLEQIFKENHLPYVSSSTGKRLQQINNCYIIDGKTKNNIETSLGSIILTFGKYKNKLISEVPKNYIEWLSENHFDNDIKKMAKQELEKRDVVYIKIN